MATHKGEVFGDIGTLSKVADMNDPTLSSQSPGPKHEDHYYGTGPALGWIFAQHFYGGQHHVWLSAEFYPYRLGNPRSSNPLRLYEGTYEPWRDRDEYDKFVQQLRLDLRKGVIAQEKRNVIVPGQASQLKDICDKVDIIFLYPIVYRVDVSALANSRLITAGSGVVHGSSEYLVRDLEYSKSEKEFKVLFLDFYGDQDFRKLITDPVVLGLDHLLNENDALQRLLDRC